MRDERAPDARAAVALADAEVLQPDPRDGLPRREARVEQCESGGLATDLGDHRLGDRAWAEQRPLE
jgi:hypothetical protein